MCAYIHYCVNLSYGVYNCDVTYWYYCKLLGHNVTPNELQVASSRHVEFEYPFSASYAASHATVINYWYACVLLSALKVPCLS